MSHAGVGKQKEKLVNIRESMCFALEMKLPCLSNYHEVTDYFYQSLWLCTITFRTGKSGPWERMGRVLRCTRLLALPFWEGIKEESACCWPFKLPAHSLPSDCLRKLPGEFLLVAGKKQERIKNKQSAQDCSFCCPVEKLFCPGCSIQSVNRPCYLWECYHWPKRSSGPFTYRSKKYRSELPVLTDYFIVLIYYFLNMEFRLRKGSVLLITEPSSNSIQANAYKVPTHVCY